MRPQLQYSRNNSGFLSASVAKKWNNRINDQAVTIISRIIWIWFNIFFLFGSYNTETHSKSSVLHILLLPLLASQIAFHFSIVLYVCVHRESDDYELLLRLHIINKAWAQIIKQIKRILLFCGIVTVFQKSPDCHKHFFI